MEGGRVSDIVTTANGRIFYAEEEHLFELDYQVNYFSFFLIFVFIIFFLSKLLDFLDNCSQILQNKSWFQRQCRKLNHSKGFLNYILPSLSILTGKEGQFGRK